MGAGGVWAEERPSVDGLLEWTESELEEWAKEVVGDTGSAIQVEMDWEEGGKVLVWESRLVGAYEKDPS